jgi:hypothetical protein
MTVKTILILTLILITLYIILRVILNLDNKLRYYIERLLYQNIKGHYTIGKVVIYGLNAMHFTIQIRSKKYGWICIRPITFYKQFPVYIYLSPDGTPSSATYYKQLGGSYRGKELEYKAKLRRWKLRHNYKIDDEKDWRWDWLDKLHNL